MLGIDPFGFAVHVLVLHDVMPPVIAPLAHIAAAAEACKYDHAFDCLAAIRKRLVDRPLQIQPVARAPAAVRGDHHLGAGIFDAILDRMGRKTAEHDGMHRADARAGLHRDHRFRHQRHINDDPVALANAMGPQRIRELADFPVQLRIAQPAHITRLALEDNRRPLAAIGQVHVEAVVADIQLPIGEPPIIGCPAVIQRDRERLMPEDLGNREVRPETDIVFRRLGVHGGELGVAQARTRRKLRRRLENPLLVQDRFDVLHASLF